MTIAISTWSPSFDPGSMTVIRPDKTVSVLETYSSVAYFSWAPMFAGKIVELRWNAMNGADFNNLDTVYQADSVVNFAPKMGDGKTYNVNLIGLDGEYLIGVGNTTAALRQNVVLRMVIMSTSTVVSS